MSTRPVSSSALAVIRRHRPRPSRDRRRRSVAVDPGCFRIASIIAIASEICVSTPDLLGKGRRPRRTHASIVDTQHREALLGQDVEDLPGAVIGPPAKPCRFWSGRSDTNTIPGTSFFFHLERSRGSDTTPASWPPSTGITISSSIQPAYGGRTESWRCGSRQQRRRLSRRIHAPELAPVTGGHLRDLSPRSRASPSHRGAARSSAAGDPSRPAPSSPAASADRATAPTVCALCPGSSSGAFWIAIASSIRSSLGTRSAFTSRELLGPQIGDRG